MAVLSGEHRRVWSGRHAICRRRANIIVRLLSSCLSALFGLDRPVDAGGGGRAGVVGMFWLALKRYGLSER